MLQTSNGYAAANREKKSKNKGNGINTGEKGKSAEIKHKTKQE